MCAGESIREGLDKNKYVIHSYIFQRLCVYTGRLQDIANFLCVRGPLKFRAVIGLTQSRIHGINVQCTSFRVYKCSGVLVYFTQK